jgi:hypothetical protein
MLKVDKLGGGEGGSCLRLINSPHLFPIVWKSACLNFLETSWSVQACKRIALHFKSHKFRN